MTESKQKTNATADALAKALAEAERAEAEKAEATRRNWSDIAQWGFDSFGKERTTEEVFARLQESLLAVADISAIVARTDIQRLIEDGYYFSLHRLAGLTQALALNALGLAELAERKDAEERARHN